MRKFEFFNTICAQQPSASSSSRCRNPLIAEEERRNQPPDFVPAVHFLSRYSMAVIVLRTIRDEGGAALVSLILSTLDDCWAAAPITANAPPKKSTASGHRKHAPWAKFRYATRDDADASSEPGCRRVAHANRIFDINAVTRRKARPSCGHRASCMRSRRCWARLAGPSTAARSCPN
jgi:hypothetical protein